MIKAGDTITLRGKSLKGKNRIREHGDQWFVREVDNSVLSRNLGLLVCPVSQVKFLTPPNPDFAGFSGWGQSEGYCRWVHPTTDQDLEVVQ